MLVTQVPHELTETLSVVWIAALAQVNDHQATRLGLQISVHPPVRVGGKNRKTLQLPATDAMLVRFLAARLSECQQCELQRKRVVLC